VPRWNSVSIIAGVDFSQCKALTVGGARFKSNFRGSITPSADGTPYVQRINKGVKGNKFGVTMEFADATMLSSALTAIQTAENLGQAFRVQLTDALNAIDVWAILDYDQESFTHGAESEGIVSNVAFQFVALSVHS